MGLEPLEFADCLTDSPFFRERVHAHEKELERTSKAIKGLITECKDLLQATRNLSKAQRNFANTLSEFKFECIGSKQTDDEIVIAHSLKKFSALIGTIEDERDRMLERACVQIINPLENFRKEQIGAAKEGKKKFDKQTNKFCQSLERYLNLKSKSNDSSLQEADAALDVERHQFYQASMTYVLQMQEVQERKKFEFVEILLGFMYGWLTFYHQGHEVSEDFKPYMTDLQIKLQKCRENFDTTHEEAEALMNKLLEVRGAKQDNPPIGIFKSCTREGYLYVMEKKALGTTWNKCYCRYQKESRILTMIPYNQVTGNKGIRDHETLILTSCTRRASDSIDKRFCFDVTVQDKTQGYTLQALNEEDRRLWLDAMDGKEPIYNQPSATNNDSKDSLLDDVGFNFIKKCIYAIEARGLTDQGLYRVVGVNSKVNKLTNMGLDRRKADKINLEDQGEWEVKTITSALKNYFRSLPEPLMTFKLHHNFIKAAEKESKTLRVNDIHHLVHQLPEANFEMLDLLIGHLKKVSENSAKNLMTVANLGVCFGPTLMRPEEETIAAIMDIKFCNIVVEILIENYEKILKSPPEGADITETQVISSSRPGALMSQSSITMGGRPEHLHYNNFMSSSTTSIGSASSVSSRQQPEPMQPPPSASSTSSSGSTNSNNTPVYANLGNSSSTSSLTQAGQTYAQVRAKLRQTAGFYSQFAPDHHSSTSSSSESLNSKSSANANMGANMASSMVANSSGIGPPGGKPERRSGAIGSAFSSIQQGKFGTVSLWW